ncbi:FUSC family protein [Actinacidiphila glaucinigra]|uniref:FUSC family protein n=1 Tax=Actinacidiphila glaucinigra TaxID=235986 RepID=UPI00380F0F46
MASDPGLIRLLSASSTVCAVLLTLGVLAALHAPIPILVTGALTATVSTVAVTEPRPRDQAVTLAAGAPVTLAIMTIGTVLRPYRVVADVVFVLLIFSAIWIRRLGPRATSLGVFAFQIFFVTQFAETRVEQLPQLSLAVLVAFGSSALIRFAVLRSPPERTLARLQRAFRLRLAQVLDALIEVAECGPGAPRSERAVDVLHRYAARLHTGALMIQTRLGTGLPDERTAAVIQRRVTEAEMAVERLAILVLRVLRPGEDVDTLTRYPAKARPAASSIDARDTVMLPALISELRASRVLIGPDRQRPAGADSVEARDRLLGYRDDEHLPDASPAMQDVFRSTGDLAAALRGLGSEIEGDTLTSREQDQGRHAPGAERSPEEPTAEDPGAGREAVRKREGSRIRPTTRSALQVAAGSALAVVGGELLSPQRWYWAVFTCWVVFISATSTGEILVRGYRRLIGTVAGVVAGLALAALIGDDPWPAFALVILGVFGMYYTTAVSYTLMSFFVTTMIGMLYALLHALTPDVLVVRIEETALGIACGLAAALLVLPVRTRERTDQVLVDVLERLRDALSRSLARLGGEPGRNLAGPAHALNSSLDSLRQSVQPLITPISPLRSRRRTALCVLGWLETAAFHTRGLAATVDAMPAAARLGVDAWVVDEAARIDRNLAALIGHVAVRGEDGTALERGRGISARLGAGSGGARSVDVHTVRRVLRHLQHVDESIQGLARTLELPVRDAP